MPGHMAGPSLPPAPTCRRVTVGASPGTGSTETLALQGQHGGTEGEVGAYDTDSTSFSLVSTWESRKWWPTYLGVPATQVGD